MFKIASYILGAGLIFGATAASAGDLAPDSADGIMNSCRPDYHRLCSFVLPGHGRVAHCLLDHEAQLAPNCRQALRIASSVEACSGDYERFCAGVPRGPQAFQCLADRMNLLNPQCRRVVSANVPYMPRQEERYGYNGGPAPYRTPAPYPEPAPYPAPAPYAGPDRYGYQGAPTDEERYPSQGAPQSRPYDDYADRDGPRYDDRYAAEGAPQTRPYDGYAYQSGPGYGEPYVQEPAPRYRPYDDRYAGGGYPGGGYDYNAPREPYGPQGER